MAWDFSKFSEVMAMRLRLAAPDVVAEALDEYGAYNTRNVHSPMADEGFERALLARQDRTIDLALALNACSRGVLEELYAKGRRGTGDEAYDRALRRAVISNTAGPATALHGGDEGLGMEEVRRIAFEGESDDLSLLMRNPERRDLLGDAFLCRRAFDGIPVERLYFIVYFAASNPNLNLDNDSEAGPDSVHWDIKKGIFNLVLTTPLEGRWIQVMHRLLLEANPFDLFLPDAPEKVRELLARLKSVKAMQMFAPEEEEGTYTGLSLVEEYRCIVAVLFGYKYADGKFHFLGPMDDADAAIRCSHYAHEDMTVKQLAAAKATECAKGDSWARILGFGGLFNRRLFSNLQLREDLEGLLVGHQRHLYLRRCQQLHAENRYFDPTPVTEAFDDGDGVTKQAADAVAVKTLREEVSKLRADFGQAVRYATWAAVVVIFTLVGIYHR